MNITVQLFATIKDRVGSPQVTLDLNSPATVEDLLEQLVERFPAVAPSLHSMIISVNQEFADRSHVITPADEIALFPPVSGG
jgi:MoaD family protein, archaeal